MIVHVHRNRHKKLWSVRTTKSGNVHCYGSFIELKDVGFHVNEKARQRVIRNRRREVHASVNGQLSAIMYEDGYELPSTVKVRLDKWKKICYDPFKTDWFVDTDGRRVVKAKVLRLLPDGKVLATGVEYREDA